MFIKYQHVMVVVGVTGILAAGGASLYVYNNMAQQARNEVEAPTAPQGLVAPSEDARPSSPRGDKASPGASEVDKTKRAIKAANATAAPNSKQKDVFGGEGWKINLYEETGDDHYDRAKIDRDRDETWDEKWTWKEGRWEKDGQVWDGAAWVDPKAAAAGKGDRKDDKKDDDDAEQAAAGDRDTSLARYATRALTERASGSKAKDITGGSGPKINLYDDDGDGKWDRGKVDTDRDEVWDQKWTIKNGTLERKIEASGEVSVFEDGAWTPKK